MPPIRSITLKRRTLLTASISLNGEVISLYSRCAKKGLVYIAITVLFSCQPSFYLEYTKANIYLLYDVRLVSINKYIFLYL